MPAHLDRLLERTSVVPAVNQVEAYPYQCQTDVLEAMAAHGNFRLAGLVADLAASPVLRGRPERVRRPRPC